MVNPNRTAAAVPNDLPSLLRELFRVTPAYILLSALGGIHSEDELGAAAVAAR